MSPVISRSLPVEFCRPDRRLRAAYQAAMALGLVPDAHGEGRPDIAPLGRPCLTASRHPGRRPSRVSPPPTSSVGKVTSASYSRRHTAPGGRNFTVRHGSLIDEIGNPQTCQFDPDPDLYLNMGPARIPGHHTALLGYCRELGVELAPFINQNRNAWVQDDAVFGGKPIRNREYVTDARGFLAELTSKCMSSGRLDDVVTKEEAEKVIDFLRTFGDLDHANAYNGSARAGLVSTDYSIAPRLKATRQFPELLKTHPLADRHDLGRERGPGGDDDGARGRHGQDRGRVSWPGSATWCKHIAGSSRRRRAIAASRSFITDPGARKQISADYC